jgi:hypothetical protein
MNTKANWSAPLLKVLAVADETKEGTGGAGDAWDLS